MKNIQRVFIVSLSMLFLTACGGGGSTPPKTTTPEVINIVTCATNTYTNLKKDDKITSLEENTEVRIRHDEDGTKKVCVRAGKAKIN